MSEVSEHSHNVGMAALGAICACQRRAAIDPPPAAATATFVPVLDSVAQLRPQATPSNRGNVPWRCGNCTAYTHAQRCAYCGAPRDSVAFRVFVGQLCRERTQPLVLAMLQHLCVDLSAPPLHIEAHTDSRNGHGKGCAWVYTNEGADVHKVVKALHRGALMDVVDGRVGFWKLPEQWSQAERFEFAAARRAQCECPTHMLPRAPVMAEESLPPEIMAQIMAQLKVHHSPHQQRHAATGAADVPQLPLDLAMVSGALHASDTDTDCPSARSSTSSGRRFRHDPYGSQGVAFVPAA